MSIKSPKISRDCKDGTPEENHEYILIRDVEGDDSVIDGTREIRYLECKHCGKQIDDDGRDYDGDDYSDDF